MKSIWIISCRAQHVCNILNGLKTQELRTRIGNIKEGDEMHLLCTKAKPYAHSRTTENTIPNTTYVLWNNIDKVSRNVQLLNGKVVAKFIVGKVEKIDDHYTDSNLHFLDILFHACLTVVDYFKYSKNKDCYALSVTQLSIFDKPRELGKYKRFIEEEYFYRVGQTTMSTHYMPITRAPQSYQRAWVEE